MNQFEIAEKLIVEGKFALAEKILNEAKVSNSEDFVAHHILLGEVLFLEERYSESIKVVEEIIPLLDKEQLLDRLNFLVRSYYSIDEPDKVILYGNSYMSLLKQFPDAEDTEDEILCMHSYISGAYYLNGDLSNAITHLNKIEQLCNKPEDWLLYYDTYVGVMITSDVIACFKACLDGLKLSSADNLLEDTDRILVRLIECCAMVADYRLAKLIYEVLENHYSEEYGGAVGMIRKKYIPRFSFQYLPRLGGKTAFEEEVIYELKRLKFIP